MKGDEYSGYTYFDNDIHFSKSEKELITENIKRILLTQKGERVGEPDFGSNVKTYLFMPQVFVSDVIDEIKNSIERCEPRVSVKSCSLISADQNDIVNIKLELELKSEDNSKSLEIEVAI